MSNYFDKYIKYKKKYSLIKSYGGTTEGQMNGGTEGQTEGQTKGQTKGQTEELAEGQTEELADRYDIANKISKFYVSILESFDDSIKNVELYKQLIIFFSIESIMNCAEFKIPTLRYVLQLSNKPFTPTNLADVPLLGYFLNPSMFYGRLLDILKIHNVELYNFYNKNNYKNYLATILTQLETVDYLPDCSDLSNYFHDLLDTNDAVDLDNIIGNIIEIFIECIRKDYDKPQPPGDFGYMITYGGYPTYEGKPKSISLITRLLYHKLHNISIQTNRDERTHTIRSIMTRMDGAIDGANFMDNDEKYYYKVFFSEAAHHYIMSNLDMLSI
jgi:hypothetical protein